MSMTRCGLAVWRSWCCIIRDIQRGPVVFFFDVKDEHRSYRVLIANMPSILDETKLTGMPTYPNVGKDYAHTFDVMKKLSFDIWVSSHAGQFGLHAKRKPGDGYRPEAFIDRRGYDRRSMI